MDKLSSFVEKIISREFIVFIIATILLNSEKLAQDLWLYCALGYIGTRTLQKFKELEIQKTITK